MKTMELYMRQQADTAREEIQAERRKTSRNTQDRRREDMTDARREINIYLSQGMDRNIAVNFVLDDSDIPILMKKEVRKFFRYGCHTICCITEGLHDIESKNSSNFVLDAI